MKHKVTRRIRVWCRKTQQARWIETGTIIWLQSDAPNQNGRFFIPDEEEDGSWETTKQDLLNSIEPL